MALLTQLRTGFKLDGRVYRVYPSGEVQYLHPKDGVYPEKVNKGRVGANNVMRSIGKNPEPAQVRARGVSMRAWAPCASCSRAAAAPRAYRSNLAGSWARSRRKNLPCPAAGVLRIRRGICRSTLKKPSVCRPVPRSSRPGAQRAALRVGPRVPASRASGGRPAGCHGPFPAPSASLRTAQRVLARFTCDRRHGRRRRRGGARLRLGAAP